nr:ABC transporter ATP-binding protein [Micromonospora sp. DSM 115978]
MTGPGENPDADRSTPGPEGSAPAAVAPAQRRGPTPIATGPGRFLMGQGAPEKSANFVVSARRLLGRLRPQRHLIAGVVGLAAVSVSLTVLGPLLLGRATDLVFTGVFSRQVPAGTTQAEVVAQLRADGHGTQAD